MSVYVDVSIRATASCEGLEEAAVASRKGFKTTCALNIAVDREGSNKAEVLRALRAKAKEEGWTIAGDQWFCKSCAPKLAPQRRGRRR